MLSDRHPEEGVRAEIGNIESIEGLRGVAVTLVVLFHYLVVRTPAAADPWNAFVSSHHALAVIVGNGYLGVDLFFLITGFLLVLPWARHAYHGRKPPSTKDFYIRRIRRIVPAYYVQLAVLLGVVMPILHGIGYWKRDIEFIGYNAVAHLLFLHYTTPISSASMSANGPLWTLALEAQYYVLLPLIAPRLVRAPFRWALALVAAAVAWRWLSLHDLGPLVRFEMGLGARWGLTEDIVRHLILTQLPGYLAHFALGILLGIAWLTLRRPDPGSRRDAGWSVVALAALGLLYWLYGMGGGAWTGTWTWLVTAALIAVAMFATVVRGVRIGDALLARGPLRFVGRVSYSAYLYHFPLLLVWNEWRVLDGDWASLPAYLAALALVSWLSYRFVEAPFMRRTARSGSARAQSHRERREDGEDLQQRHAP
jgi:peptidoglycan/LPS O-acetylase OafA/YrhL